MLSLRLQQTELTAGEWLSGTVSWMGQKSPQEIHLTIAWRTEGRGTVDTAKLHEMSLASGDNFRYRILPTGPYSYDGQLIRVIWEVSAVAQMGGFLSKSPKEVKVFRVVPR
ncbi:hypothetical protein [Phormidesmis priestleyi]